MGKPLNLQGQTFGRLKVLYQAPGKLYGKHREPKRRWVCQCECGNIITTTTENLRGGDTRSCGCLKMEMDKAKYTTHGKSKTRLYRIWKKMRARCQRSSCSDYAYYGGRGISVCDEWNNSFLSFEAWAYENGYDDKLTIDRIDVDRNYEPSNCRWATMKEQSNNRRNSRQYTYQNETHSIAEWANIVGIPYQTLYMRLRKGLTIDEALNYHRK